jgi:hypothetical protein
MVNNFKRSSHPRLQSSNIVKVASLLEFSADRISNLGCWYMYWVCGPEVPGSTRDVIKLSQFQFFSRVSDLTGFLCKLSLTDTALLVPGRLRTRGGITCFQSQPLEANCSHKIADTHDTTHCTFHTVPSCQRTRMILYTWKMNAGNLFVRSMSAGDCGSRIVSCLSRLMARVYSTCIIVPKAGFVHVA